MNNTINALKDKLDNVTTSEKETLLNQRLAKLEDDKKKLKERIKELESGKPTGEGESKKGFSLRSFLLDW